MFARAENATTIRSLWPTALIAAPNRKFAASVAETGGICEKPEKLW
jgi:hypothetical protein